ncbi:MAG: hypothetical protein ABJU46_01325 [Paracoccaceae bacterium]
MQERYLRLGDLKMTFRSAVTVTIIASTFAFAGSANAQFGGVNFPTLTWSDDYKPADRNKQVVLKDVKE